MSNSTILRRDFLKGSAWATALFGLPAWANGLDENLPASYMSFSTANYPLEWNAPADLANTDPAVVILNRITFGPRPGEVEHVREMGIDNFIEEQLSPERIDDSRLDARLKQFPSLTMTIPELVQNYANALLQKRADKNADDNPITDVGGALRGFLGLFGVNDSPSAATTAGALATPAQVITEIIQATVVRQMFSERQLFETMADFWSNHFNIYILKNQDKVLKTVDDRAVVRKYALGKFSDLLHASASSPAMLVYLDNLTNVKGVPNENYARELMELHTLSVNGGYTQTDVQELARCFTGWTVNPPRRSILGIEYDDAGEFLFRPDQHDDGEKTVLGVKIPAGGGIKDAETMLDVLAHHPKTAQFISQKLVARFVSDDPPASLVAQAVDSFTKSDGDIRAVMSTILHSDEFKLSFGQKAKRPLEFIAAAVRAVGAAGDLSGKPNKYPKIPAGKNNNKPKPVSQTQPVATALRVMGQVPFMWQSPNGYPDNASAWINSNNLLARWNFALALANDTVPGLNVDLDAATNGVNVASAEALVDFWTDSILHRSIPDADRAKLIQFVNGDNSGSAATNLVALILSSPHFQYR